MIEPIREFGIMNLMVTARLPGTEGTSKGSSLIRRTIKPKACQRHGDPLQGWFHRKKKTNLRDRVERSTDVENTLGVTRDTLRDHNTGATLFPDFVNVSTSLANDNGCVLGDYETAHVDGG
jgi:hypothetical protein